MAIYSTRDNAYTICIVTRDVKNALVVTLFALKMNNLFKCMYEMYLSNEILLGTFFYYKYTTS